MATHLDTTTANKTEKPSQTGQAAPTQQRTPAQGAPVPATYRFKDYASI